jgi:hypothetical protein
MVFLTKTNYYQKKKCNTNKNVTKMDVITKRVYSRSTLNQFEVFNHGTRVGAGSQTKIIMLT